MENNNLKPSDVPATEPMLDYVKKCLKHANEHGLDTEVVTWALIRMKENPNLTIQEAMEAGCQEWDV